MNKALAIIKLFPDARDGVDFEVIDNMDGKGQQIEFWSLGIAKPTDEELQKAWDEYLTVPKEASLDEKIEKLEADKKLMEEQMACLTEKNIINDQAIMELSLMVSSLFSLEPGNDSGGNEELPQEPTTPTEGDSETTPESGEVQ